jgi:hypothetical protein
MHHVVTASLLSVLGFSLGLLLMHVFGAPGDERRIEKASVRLRSESPARR